MATKYTEVKVTFSIEDEKGKVKKTNVKYLVDAQSPTEAEARITQKLIDDGETDFEVKDTKESKIFEVVESAEKEK